MNEQPRKPASFNPQHQASFDKAPTGSLIAEALAKQAASRAPKSPPRAMPVTPVLPRQPKPKKRRVYSTGSTKKMV